MDGAQPDRFQTAIKQLSQQHDLLLEAVDLAFDKLKAALAVANEDAVTTMGKPQEAKPGFLKMIRNRKA